MHFERRTSRELLHSDTPWRVHRPGSRLDSGVGIFMEAATIGVAAGNTDKHSYRHFWCPTGRAPTADQEPRHRLNALRCHDSSRPTVFRCTTTAAAESGETAIRFPPVTSTPARMAAAADSPDASPRTPAA
jgi:hypothetical protein